MLLFNGVVANSTVILVSTEDINIYIRLNSIIAIIIMIIIFVYLWLTDRNQHRNGKIQ